MKLAELCGTSTSYIGELEIGKKFPSIEMMQKIAAALEIEPYKFLMDEDAVEVRPFSKKMKHELIEELTESIKSIVEKK